MQLQGLTRIIQSFKPAECDLIREYYLRKNNGSATKRLQLFDLLNNRLAKSSEHVSKLLYNRKPDSGFSQLKKRLKEDLLDFLVFFSSNKGDRPNTDSAELECRRLFVQAQTLVQKGIADEAIGVLKKVQKLAKENDLPEMKAKAMDLLQAISDQSFADFKSSAAQVESEFEIHLLQVKARNLYQRLKSEEGAAFWEDKDLELLTQLQDMALSFSTPGLLYWYHLIKLLYHKAEGQLARAYHSALLLNHAIQANLTTYNKGQQLDFYLELSDLLYTAGKYKKAELFTRKAEMLCGNECPDLLKVLKLRFMVHFGQKQYKVCDQVLSQAMVHPALKEEGSEKQIWQFFEACTHFVDGNFRVAQALLHQCTSLTRDKSGLFLEPRILELLNLVELNDFDLLEYKVESFRKLIEYHKDLCPDHVPQVLKVLKAFVRSGFDLEATCGMEGELMARMLHTEPYHGLVDVQAWLLSKLKVDDLRLVG